MVKLILKKFELFRSANSWIPAFAGMTTFIHCFTKSVRFGADCAKRLPDSALVCVERQTFVQGVPKLALLIRRRRRLELLVDTFSSYDRYVYEQQHAGHSPSPWHSQ